MLYNNETVTNNAVLLQAGAAIGEAKKNPEKDGRPYAVVPDGFDLQVLPIRNFPDRACGTVKLRDAASFIEYTNAHKIAGVSRIYATLEPAMFLAVLDDFGENKGGGIGIDDAANWREWRAQFLVPMSREWKTWAGKDKSRMSQKDFGEFLQDNLPDVVEPDGATLLEMSMNFEASTAGTFRSVQRLQDGSHTFIWANENNANGTVKLPAEIKLAIPVFENGASYVVAARLRHQVKEGTLAIWYELVRPHKILEAAFRGTWEHIKTGTELPLLLGTPE